MTEQLDNFDWLAVLVLVKRYTGTPEGNQMNSTQLLEIHFFYLFFQLGNRKAYEAFQEGGEEGLKEYIYSKMWNPEYRYFPLMQFLLTANIFESGPMPTP